MTLPSKFCSMLRVNQAGEYGAVRIYKAQIDVFEKKTADPRTLEITSQMLKQEEEHLDAFNTLMIQHGVRPTLLTPLWHVAGYAMGAFTALISEKAAHACTIAVEEVIDEHYRSQIEELEKTNDPEAEKLHALFQRCQQDELHHKEIAENEGGRDAYPLLSGAIKIVSRLAIEISKRV